MLKNKNVHKVIFVTSIVVALVACGGGSSTGGSSSLSVSSSSSSESSSSSSLSSSSSSTSSSVAATCQGFGAASVAAGFSVLAGELIDGQGQAFQMRGVNYPYVWFSARDTEQDLKDIRSVCANTVRIVLANGEQWTRVSGAEISNIIAWAKAAGLVTVLEVHDSTGWDDGASADPETAVDYWLSEDVRAALEDEEGYVLINIANEAFGNNKTAQWESFHKSAISRLRSAGINHTLVVDAPNWGQDWSNTMRDGSAAQSIFEADVNANTLFSVHMYDVYNTESKVEEYFQAFSDKNLPLIIGEFAADHGSGNNVEEDAVLVGAETYGFGYLGWSWSGNNGDLDSLDIVEDFNVNTLTPWGDRLINGANGFKATSNLCGCMLDEAL